MVGIFNDLLLFIETFGTYSIIVSSFLILIESMFPVLPLFVFITVNYYLLGGVLGFIISWTFTVLGCIMSYEIFKRGLGNRFENLTQDRQLINKYTKMFKNISTGKLLLIIAFPFTPAFAINIAAGLSKMEFKKFLTALLFGKISLVIYSAYLGSSIIESIKNPILLLKTLALVLGTYLLYIIFRKIFKMEV